MMKKLLISFAENFDDEKMVFLDFDFQSNDVEFRAEKMTAWKLKTNVSTANTKNFMFLLV